MTRIIDLSRQCPLCEGADQHEVGCALDGKEHVFRENFFDEKGPEYIDWDATLKLNGMSFPAEHK